MELVQTETELGSGPISTVVGQRNWAIPALLVGSAFGFRIVLGYLFTYYGGDAPGYTIIGRNLAAGRGYSVALHAPYLATDIRLPGYPALLALAFSVSSSHWVVILLNALLGAFSTLLVWYIARGLHLTRTMALWSMGIAAFCLATASFAGIALSENLSVPAVLAFVYVVLVKPPQSLLRLFVLGSVLAWVVALTRDELVIFVVLTAVVAARRANLRVVGTVLLVACFLLGSGAWVIRNQVQVHRTELVDSLMSDAVVVATLNGQNFSAPLYVRSQNMAFDPRTTQAQRAQVQQQVYAYAKHMILHEPLTVAEQQATYYLEAFFPVPIFGVTYASSLLFLERMVWSVFLLAEYALALVTAVKWWGVGRHRDIVSIGLFPAFIMAFMVFIQPVFRCWLPSVLLLLPAAVAGAAALNIRELAAKLTVAGSPPPPRR
jgi:hypothetical protein